MRDFVSGAYSRVVLFFCGLWMLMGILVMRKMVNFSI